MMWLMLPLRNLFRHLRRSIYSGVIVAFALAALALFDGFTSFMFDSIREMVIYSGTGGHLQIATQSFVDGDLSEETQALISGEAVAAIEKLLSADERIVVVAPKIRVSGLLSNGQKSVPFRANGMRAADRLAILKQAQGIIALMVKKQIDAPPPPTYGIRLGNGLASILSVQKGDTTVALTSTLDGLVNALDFEVFDTFSVPQAELSSLAANISLSAAQSLYDTTAVHELAIVLQRGIDEKLIARELQETVGKVDHTLVIRTWRERDPLYDSVKSLFNTIFSFMFVILVIIIGLAVTITVSMNVAERTREFGAMRALGLTKLGLIRLIATENLFLAIASILLGVGIFAAASQYVEHARLSWQPPLFSLKMPIVISSNPDHITYIGGLLALMVVAVATATASRAARKPIVDALAYH